MDAGCELHGYCSDVTRTWPASGTFSAEQRAVYEVVLHTHRRCLEACRPGALLRTIHALSIRLVSEGIAQLGLLQHMGAQDVAMGPYRQFYPHSVGHWLGMDTHDVSSISHDTMLQPGVVLTVEPGLYIPDVPELYGRFAGIGVRLEDDVLITEKGAHRVLSGALPLEVDDVEHMVQQGL